MGEVPVSYVFVYFSLRSFFPFQSTALQTSRSLRCIFALQDFDDPFLQLILNRSLQYGSVSPFHNRPTPGRELSWLQREARYCHLAKKGRSRYRATGASHIQVR